MIFRLFRSAQRQCRHCFELYGITLLKISIGIIFVWFGALKFVSGLSPAETLATNTLRILSFELISSEVLRYILATGECLIGICLCFNIGIRWIIPALFLHMLGTFSPLLFFPEQIFTHFPFGLTLEGQYIMKNVVIISAAMVISSQTQQATAQQTDDS